MLALGFDTIVFTPHIYVCYKTTSLLWDMNPFIPCQLNKNLDVNFKVSKVTVIWYNSSVKHSLPTKCPGDTLLACL